MPAALAAPGADADPGQHVPHLGPGPWLVPAAAATASGALMERDTFAPAVGPDPDRNALDPSARMSVSIEPLAGFGIGVPPRERDYRGLQAATSSGYLGELSSRSSTT